MVIERRRVTERRFNRRIFVARATPLITATSTVVALAPLRPVVALALLWPVVAIVPATATAPSPTVVLFGAAHDLRRSDGVQ
jgi:hypothetical protein